MAKKKNDDLGQCFSQFTGLAALSLFFSSARLALFARRPFGFHPISVFWRKFVTLFAVGGWMRNYPTLPALFLVMDNTARPTTSVSGIRTVKQIISCKQMSANAMSLSRIFHRFSISSHNILVWRDHFNMFRINTRWHATKMVAVQILRRYVNKQSIHQPMGSQIQPLHSENAVFMGTIRKPKPAIGLVARIFDSNVGKQLRKQLTGKDNFAIIVSSHCSKDNSFMNVVRDLSGVNYLSSPVSILA